MGARSKKNRSNMTTGPKTFGFCKAGKPKNFDIVLLF